MIINFYGFFIALAVLLATLVAEYVRKKITSYHLKSNLNLFDLLPWVVIPAIIGARLYHVIDYFDYYIQFPGKIIAVWQGGLGIYGAIIGGIAGLLIFTKFSNFSTSQFLSYLDLAAIGLPIGQAIGRLGNFFNQELYGLPTSLPWGIDIRLENRLAGYEGFSHFHPLFLYESLGNIIIFLILILLITHYENLLTKEKRGSLFLVYLFLYSCLRFFLEFLRIESWKINFLGISFGVNQLLSVFFMTLSLTLLLLYKRQKDS